MPALQASKCAKWQGEQAFTRYHLALYEAFFKKNRNISDPEVLVDMAKECELDVDKFVSDFEGGIVREQVLAEYEEGHSQFEGWGVPLVIIGDRYPIVGAVPIDVYRRAIGLCLARQTE
jgi:predicted DsbA family dithiol-disulfide isomerase